MAGECKIAGLFETGFEGIISAQITGSQEFIEIVSNCDEAPNVFNDVRKVLKGPSLGSLTMTTYAFPKGSTNRFLGTACPSSASISLPIQGRFDCENNVTRLIRTKTGEASREGDPIEGITLLNEFCSFRTINASAQGNPANRVTDNETFLGSDLIWTGLVFPFDSRDPDSMDFNILGLDVKLTNFSVSVSAPTVATTNYSFSYAIPSCEGDLGV